MGKKKMEKHESLTLHFYESKAEETKTLEDVANTVPDPASASFPTLEDALKVRTTPALALKKELHPALPVPTGASWCDKLKQNERTVKKDLHPEEKKEQALVEVDKFQVTEDSESIRERNRAILRKKQSNLRKKKMESLTLHFYESKAEETKTLDEVTNTVPDPESSFPTLEEALKERTAVRTHALPLEKELEPALPLKKASWCRTLKLAIEKERKEQQPEEKKEQALHKEVITLEEKQPEALEKGASRREEKKKEQPEAALESPFSLLSYGHEDLGLLREMVEEELQV